MRVVAALVLMFPLVCTAQADAAVAKPEVKVGDRWIYRRTDHRLKPPVFVYEMRVTFVDSRAIHAVLARQGEQRESDATWTPEWNGVVSVDEGVVELDGGLLQFPLSIGRAYQAAWQIRRPRVGAFHVRHERAVRVMGWEEIAVPAGKFRALKVEAEGLYRRLDASKSDWARNTVWYVPEVKRWVKSSYEDAFGLIGEELVYFRLQ
jgi:hypothetical protein